MNMRHDYSEREDVLFAAALMVGIVLGLVALMLCWHYSAWEVMFDRPQVRVVPAIPHLDAPTEMPRAEWPRIELPRIEIVPEAHADAPQPAPEAPPVVEPPKEPPQKITHGRPRPVRRHWVQKPELECTFWPFFQGLDGAAGIDAPCAHEGARDGTLKTTLPRNR